MRVDFRLGAKHVLSGLGVLLQIDASGRFDRPVRFAGETFAAGEVVAARYRFNSYRLTYRYEPVHGDTWTFGVGVTAKVRDAITRLESGARSSEKANVGFGTRQLHAGPSTGRWRDVPG